MYRSKLPKNGKLLVSKETIQKLKEFLKNKSSQKTQEEITMENKRRLEVLDNLALPMKDEIRQYLKEQGVLFTDVKLETMEEAKEFVKELDNHIPSDELLERVKKEGALKQNDDGEWVVMEMCKG
jgi:flavorubredoxin